MAYDPREHHRRSIRLSGYDYSSEGAYFVTMCVRDRKRALGEVRGGKVRLSPIGRIVQKCWLTLSESFTMVGLDEFVIMPDHLHGIIVIYSLDLINQIQTQIRTQIRTGDQIPAEMIPLGIDESHFGVQASFPLMKNPKTTLGKIIRHFKARATKLIHDEGFSAFRWQSNYYEQILRDEEHLDRVRAYILNNPLNWSMDRGDRGRNSPITPSHNDSIV